MSGFVLPVNTGEGALIRSQTLLSVMSSKKKKRTEEELHTIATVRIHGQKSKKKSKYIRFKKTDWPVCCSVYL